MQTCCKGRITMSTQHRDETMMEDRGDQGRNPTATDSRRMTNTQQNTVIKNDGDQTAE